MRYRVAPTPALPGVWRKEGGGFLVVGKAKHPTTGKTHRIVNSLDVGTPTEARAWLDAEQARIRSGAPSPALPPALPTFADYAGSLGARKARDGRLKSAHSREVYDGTVKNHLVPTFGSAPVDTIRRADVIAWRDAAAARVRAGELSPHTVNQHLRVLKTILTCAVHEFELARNPVAGVEPIDTSAHATYTREQPNSLTPEEARVFLARLRVLYPQHYAFVALSLATGLRPSSLRPLRRCGPHADVLWGEDALLVRRSHTRRDEVMATTKTGFRQRIGLPKELMEVLRAHVDELEPGPQLESELLFPSDEGGFRAPSTLDKPFRAVSKAIGLKKRFTPRGLRRTFQDMARAAEVNDIVTRSISGHRTEEMQEHYSTPLEREQRAGLAKVIDLAGVRLTLASGT